MTGRTAQATHPRTTHDDALARARAVTASDTWDLDRRFPIVLDRGSEAYVWDVQGRRYLDLTSCSGAAPLGAGHPGVVEAATRAMVRTGGILPGPLSLLRVELAERLVDLFPCAQRAVFFRTGSCATTAAVRLARVHTGARPVLTSGYHGWHDWHLQYRPHLALADRDPDTTDFGYDLDRLADLASRHGRIAAVIVTPEVNFFPREHLRQVAEIARRHGGLVVVDEVMTGFRYAPGGYHAAAGVDADLIAVSKGLANGFALSAVLGRAEVMKADEATYLGNTYQREVTPFAAALATLDAYADGTVPERIRTVGTRLMAGLNEVFAAHGVPAVARSWPTMFDVVFADPDLGTRFFQEMWRRGFLMQYGGRFMPSAATSDEDVRAVTDAAHAALRATLADAGPAPAGDHHADDRLRAAAVEFAGQNFAATPQAVRTWFGRPD
ncbi:aminotransferase class III-fold pyridoxal phosphate-dependent enzyme [Micromonospora fluostatini]